MKFFVDGGYQNNVYERLSLETAGCEAGNNVTILICIFLFARFELISFVTLHRNNTETTIERGTRNVPLRAFVHPFLLWKSNKYYIF